MVERRVTGYEVKAKATNCIRCSEKLTVKSFGVDKSKGFSGKVNHVGWFCNWACYSNYTIEHKEKLAEDYIHQNVYD